MSQNNKISLSLANKIDILNKTQSVDARYGVYDTRSDALLSMQSYGADGRQVAVYTDKPNGKVELLIYNEVLDQLDPISAPNGSANNGILTISKNGVDIDTFSADQASDKTIDIIVPTKTSDLTNDSNFTTTAEVNNVYIKKTEKGSSNGVAELDGTGKVPASQLPSYVDDVVEGYLSSGIFYLDSGLTEQITGESGKIYVNLLNEKTYRWTGTGYAVISETIALGEASTTAYRGDRGKIAYDHSQAAHAPSNAQKNSDITKGEIEDKLIGNITSHSHTVTKANVGLGNVDNTSDLAKPISTAAQTALNGKLGTGAEAYDSARLGGELASNFYTKIASEGMFKPIGYQPTWAQVANRPTSFPPSSHNHIIGDITDLQTALNGKENSFTKNNAFNKTFGTGSENVPRGNDSRINNGQAAYNWGNHASAGYIKSYVDTVYSAGNGISISGANVISIEGGIIDGGNASD